MAKRKSDPKMLELKRTSTLHPHPEAVADPLFQDAGLAGLLPQPRGPKEAHKLSAEVLDYVAGLQKDKPELTTVQCVQAVQDRFGITIHRRSLERARLRRKKK